MDIEAWLQDLGLERYVSAFRDNEIDEEVLPKLTSEDLREIGVAAIGHRRKLLNAIAALGTEMPATAVTAASRDAPAQAHNPHRRARHRAPRPRGDGGSPRCPGASRCRTPATLRDVL